MDDNMVITRQQQRRQGALSEQNASITDDSRPILGIGDMEGSGRSPRDSVIFERDRPSRSPRESVFWSMGDHQGIRNQNSMQQLSQAMQDMQAKVSGIEHSLQSVTAELRGVIQNFNAQNPKNLSRAIQFSPGERFLIDRAIGLGHIAAVTVRIIAVWVQLQIQPRGLTGET